MSGTATRNAGATKPSRRIAGRLGGILAITALWVLLPATAASAHTIGGQGATNYRTIVTGITPAVPGITVRVIENGSRLELRNTTSADLLVLGYSTEPYLRIGPAGVFENVRSTSTYLNSSRQYGAVPASADDKAAPVWRKLGDQPVVRWHDHSAHYMAPTPPPAVQADPGHEHDIGDWWRTLRWQGQTLTVHGSLLWVPGPSSWPWWCLVSLLVLGTAALALLPAYLLAIGAAAAALVVIDALHSTGIALDSAGDASSQLGAFASANAVEAVAWLITLGGVVLLARRRVGGLFAAGTGAAAMGAIGGLGDIGTLSHSSAPFVWSTTLARLLTAGTVGVGLGVVVAAVLAVRRHDRASSRAPAARAGAAEQTSLDITDDLLIRGPGT